MFSTALRYAGTDVNGPFFNPKSPVTIFAPTNDAYNTLFFIFNQTTPELGTPFQFYTNTTALNLFMRYLVVPGTYKVTNAHGAGNQPHDHMGLAMPIPAHLLLQAADLENNQQLPTMAVGADGKPLNLTAIRTPLTPQLTRLTVSGRAGLASVPSGLRVGPHAPFPPPRRSTPSGACLPSSSRERRTSRPAMRRCRWWTRSPRPSPSTRPCWRRTPWSRRGGARARGGGGRLTAPMPWPQQAVSVIEQPLARPLVAGSPGGAPAALGARPRRQHGPGAVRAPRARRADPGRRGIQPRRPRRQASRRPPRGDPGCAPRSGTRACRGGRGGHDPNHSASGASPCRDTRHDARRHASDAGSEPCRDARWDTGNDARHDACRHCCDAGSHTCGDTRCCHACCHACSDACGDACRHPGPGCPAVAVNSDGAAALSDP